MPPIDALLVVSFGGPEGPDDVMPFLERVTRGRGVPRERLEAVAHHYLAVGGVSPINEQNRHLLRALRTELDARGVELPLYWGNRNSDPFIAATISDMHEAGHATVLAITTSAYSSYSSCRQYREDLAGALESTGLAGRIRIEKVRPYFDHPGFLEPIAMGVRDALVETDSAGIPRSLVRLFFSTHSIPVAMAETSGPPDRRATFEGGGAYVAQHLAVARAVMARVAGATPGGAASAAGDTTPAPGDAPSSASLPAWSLVYQSRSGDGHVPWLEPDVNDALRAAAGEGMAAAIVVPIGFTSDHVEVVWDLDHEAAETAAELGVRLIRVPTPGTDPAFVRGLVDLVDERLGGAAAANETPLGPWPGVCAIGCCPNLRRELPAVAGADSEF
jgi:protoporphyrin/coproporphyrin ferrochelatase